MEELFNASQKNQLPDLMRRLDFKRNSPLHAAILNGHVDAVKILLAAGANPRAINEEKRTPMHLAVATREIDIVRVLVEKAMFNNIRDGNWETPLDLAAKEGSLEIMKLLLDNAVHAKDYEQSYFQNLVLPPALFLACRSGYADIVELLLRKETAFGGYRNMDSIRAAFQICVDEKRKTCALVLLKLDWWKQSGIDNELMCNIIRETPDIAKSIFDECIFERPDMTFELECNYLILTSYPPEEKKKPPRHNQVDFEEKVVKAIEPIVVRDPLEEIIECEDDELLCHPLVINVVEQLWNSFAIDYFLAILLLYLAFLATFTAFIMYLPLTTGTNCVVTANFTIHSSTTTQTELVLKILQICVLTLAGIQLFKELIQLLAGIVSMFKTRSAPDIFSFRNVENLIEWTLYTMSILTVSNEDPCATETSINREVQNNIPVIAIFLAWINLIFLLRKLPTLGIYIVMAIDIFKTLMTFSVVLIMFLVAFAFGFHRALSNQIAFKDMGRSLLKTFVMMTGEYEYKDTFNARFETLTQENNIVYPIATYFLFVIFILTMNILIMNLMIGLSVYDISAMKEKAKPTKYRELILFILETKTIRRRLRLPDLETDHGRIIVSPARLYQKALPFICYKGFKELERFNRSRKSETNVLKENQEKADRILRQQDEKADDTIKRLKSMKEFLDTTFGQASGGRGQAAGRTNDTTASRLDKLEAMFQANQAILQNLQTMVEGMAQK